MKNKFINFYSACVTPEMLKKVVEKNYLPIFVIRHIANSSLIGKYSHTAVHIPELSPSSILFQSFRDNFLTYEEFEKEYRKELSVVDFPHFYHRFEIMTDLCNTDTVVLLGYGKDYEISTRKILADVLCKSKEVPISVVKEVSYEEI